MARIRTIKPEFFTDDTVGELSPTARLLFIGTWVFADDHGTLDRSAKQLKAQVFPYDGVDCEPLILELIAAGLLVEYDGDGRTFLHIAGFSDHQRIDKPSKARRPLPEYSASTPSGREGKGKEGKGSDGEEAAPPAGLDLGAWKRWADYRSEIRRPLKPVSIPAAQRELAAFGADQAAVVEQSVANGWQGLFALKARPPGAKSSRPPPTDQEIAAAREAAAAANQRELERKVGSVGRAFAQ